MALNKEAAVFMPKWATGTAAAAPAPAAQSTTATNGEHVAGAATAKLSSTAAAFVPRSARLATAVTAAPSPAPAKASSSSSTIAGGAPPTVQGAWKRPPAANVLGKAPSPAAKPATPAAKAVSPAHKSVSPAMNPAHPGQLYKSPSHRPVESTAAMEAARKATLKKEAAAFIPKGFAPPPPMKMVTPPITPQHRPAPTSDEVMDPNALMPLNRMWSLYFVDRAPVGTAAYDPTLVYQIKSVEDFWRTVNNVPTLTHGNMGSTYYFFRDKIQPKWEDEANKQGGAWTLRLFSSRDLTSEAIDEIWERLLARAIGEAWPSTLQGNLIGLVAKMRDRCITLQFWVTGMHEDFPKEIANTISGIYKAFKMEYLSHEAAKVAADEREKVEREKAKAQQKKQKKRH